MSEVISGGSVPAGEIADVYTYIAIPENNAQVSEITYLFHKDSAPGFQIGGSTPHGEITEVRRPSHIGGNIYRQVVEAAEMPRRYTIGHHTVHTFPGRSPPPGFSNRLSRYGSIRPYTLHVLGRMEVQFLSQFAAARVKPDNPTVPTFDGEPVDFFGTVYDSDGNAIGETDPRNPPIRYIVSDTVRKWRGKIWMRETLTVPRYNPT